MKKIVCFATLTFNLLASLFADDSFLFLSGSNNLFYHFGKNKVSCERFMEDDTITNFSGFYNNKIIYIKQIKPSITTGQICEFDIGTRKTRVLFTCENCYDVTTLQNNKLYRVEHSPDKDDSEVIVVYDLEQKTTSIYSTINFAALTVEIKLRNIFINERNGYLLCNFENLTNWKNPNATEFIIYSLKENRIVMHEKGEIIRQSSSCMYEQIFLNTNKQLYSLDLTTMRKNKITIVNDNNEVIDQSLIPSFISCDNYKGFVVLKDTKPSVIAKLLLGYGNAVLIKYYLFYIDGHKMVLNRQVNIDEKILIKDVF